MCFAASVDNQDIYVERSPCEKDEDDQAYINHCQETYGIDGLIEFTEGENGLPLAILRHPSGAEAEVYLHGACISSFQRPDASEILWLSDDNTYNGRDPIAGGVSIAWPEYGQQGGLLQNLHWSVIAATADQDSEDDDPKPTLSLYVSSNGANEEEEEEEEFPHAFEAVYHITLRRPPTPGEDDDDVSSDNEDATKASSKKASSKAAAIDAASTILPHEEKRKPSFVQRGGRAEEEPEDEYPVPPPMQLSCVLHVRNAGEEPIEFTGGLKNHFAIKDVRDPYNDARFIKLLGLRGQLHYDFTRHKMKPRVGIDQEHFTLFNSGKDIDRLYCNVDPRGDILFCPGDRTHVSLNAKDGFRDIGVHHPGYSQPALALTHVCMSVARGSRPFALAPGGEWLGRMELTSHCEYWVPPSFEPPHLVPIPSQSEITLPVRQKERM